MFGLFKKKKGCLDGKTTQQILSFFNSLSKFEDKSPMFFKEQYGDLLIDEKKQYNAWKKGIVWAKIKL